MDNNSKKYALYIIRAVMQQIKEVEVLPDLSDNIKAQITTWARKGALDYSIVEKMAEDDPRIPTYCEEYTRNSLVLYKLLNPLKENPNQQTRREDSENKGGNTMSQKNIVINALKNLENKIAEALNIIANDSKEAFYLRAVRTEITNDLANIAGLSEEDPTLQTYFNKYHDIEKRIDAMVNSARKPIQKQPTSNNNASDPLDVFFKSSRSAARINKEEVVNLMANCKLKLWQLNEDSLITLQDLPVWERLFEKVSSDYQEAMNIDSRDKQRLEVFFKEYTILEKDIDRLVQDCTEKNEPKINSNQEKVLTKAAVLRKIKDAQEKNIDILNNMKLSFKEKRHLKDIAADICDMKREAEALDEFKDRAALESLDKEADEILNELNGYRPNTRHKVTRVVKDKDQSRKTRDSRNSAIATIGKYVAGGALGALIAALIIYGSVKLVNHLSNEKDNDNNLPQRPSAGDTNNNTITSSIDNIDIENYENLLGYAMEIQAKLPADTPLSLDDIMYAVYLANFDNLKDKAIFSDRDEVCASAYAIGTIAQGSGVNSILQKDANSDIYLTDTQMLDVTVCATDLNVSVNDFSAAKTDKGYDVYTVCQICLDNMYGADPVKAEAFCKIFNEITARVHLDFSLIANCPISTRFTLAGMYTANSAKILELTSGQTLGPIYGSGTRIDGTHGYMCVEELEAFMKISRAKGEAVGNENNMLYTAVIDDNITCYKAQTR